ncbi:MAG TPA: DNA mismatch repair protein MutS [Dehalococcoidia bacterium]|nr:DNA mismatch repair protein MutS [Dehalococcoidia bacterium]
MKITPLRQQYLNIKNRYRDCILLFRLGDFYETFDEDAKIVSKELGIALTSREMGKGNRVPLAGIPYHAIDNYLSRLINIGYKIAICEQLTPPGQGLVERDVIRVVTPGTLIEPQLLKEKSNNYLASIFIKGETAGIAYVDISTGEFFSTQCSSERILDEISRINPSEIIIPDNINLSNLNPKATLTPLDRSIFQYDNACAGLSKYLEKTDINRPGYEHLPLAVQAAGAIVFYVHSTQKSSLSLINELNIYSINAYMIMDSQTRNNLELFASLRSGTAHHTLLSVIDFTRTSMGSRLLANWMSQPLLDIYEIRQRQDYVDFFYRENLIRNKTAALLSSIYDLERLINRIKSYHALPRELRALALSLSKNAQLKELLSSSACPKSLYRSLSQFKELISLIESSITDDPQARTDGGLVIKKGYSEELDGIRDISSDAKRYLKDLEQNERERTGIKSLKVLYNRVFGYYIEISKANLNMVPDDYVRKQTLVNAERYYTPELKEYELSILNAQEKIIELDSAIFKRICAQVAENSSLIAETSASVAAIDVAVALAESAHKYDYHKPEINNGESIIIKSGRHPVVERTISADKFIPNDSNLDTAHNQVIILTGPNMSGKSTYIKQMALIVLLAQIGSYVPADSACIGVVDRIFTRIGAQEDLAAGQSTFMVEMCETANILQNATKRSLVILDEVGRGTSTYDGMSIAWAVVEYVHNNPKLKCKTLFATHYHELVQLADALPRVQNFCISVSETNGKVTFLHKIIPGGMDKSYGIHVAELAGIPSAVTDRARNILISLEKEDISMISNRHEIVQQMNLFDSGSGITDELINLDIDSLTPLEAITKLYHLKRILKEQE